MYAVLKLYIPELRRCNDYRQSCQLWEKARQRMHMSARTWFAMLCGFAMYLATDKLIDWLKESLRLTVLPRSLLGFTAGLTCALTIALIVRPYARKRVRKEMQQAGIPICIPCGYDLEGNRTGVCPECGTDRNAVPIPNNK